MYSHVFYNKFMGSSSHWLHIEATNKTEMFPTLITILTTKSVSASTYK